jgi:hypothetical protein
MTDPLARKTRLVILTPYTERGRNIIAEVKPWGLELREKGRRFRMEITWGSIYHRAAEIAADKARAERKAKREAAKKARRTR